MTWVFLKKLTPDIFYYYSYKPVKQCEFSIINSDVSYVILYKTFLKKICNK